MNPSEIFIFYYLRIYYYFCKLLNPLFEYENFDGKTRNPARIGVILDRFETIWRENPDLRFNQLVLNLTNDYDDIFYLEDDKFEELLNKVIKTKKLGR